MQRSIALQESTSTRLSCSLSLAGNKHLMKHLLSISQTRTQGAQWPSRASMVSHVIEVCIYPKQGDGEIIWDYIFWFISLLSPVVSTCFFAGMINTEKKYCAEVCMASFPRSLLLLYLRGEWLGTRLCSVCQCFRERGLFEFQSGTFC